MPVIKLIRKGTKLLRTAGGKLTKDLDCCCGECPCCWQSSITILRDDTTPTWTRASATPGTGFGCVFTDGGDMGAAGAMQCSDETFALSIDLTPACQCQWRHDSDVNYYDTRPCYQQFYTEAAEDGVCDYGPVGALGMETHKGTWSFRHVISINMCYDQCGLMNITISHKIYCEFGVYVLDVPTSPISPITENWYSDGTPVLIQDSLWAWVDIPTPTCGSEYTLPAPDLADCVLAAAYTKTWGRAYTNCGGASSFTRTFPAACAATGLTLNGTGDECTC